MDQNLNQSNKKNDLPNLKTYTSDLAEAIREKEISVIKIAMAEKEKREREELIRQSEPSRFSKFFLVIGGIILLAGSVGGIYYLTVKKNNIPAPIILNKNFDALISYDEKIIIDTTPLDYQEVRNTFESEIKKSGKEKSVTAIFFTTKINGPEELIPKENIFSIFDLSIPAPIKRSLTDRYMVGIYQQSQNPTEGMMDGNDETIAENKITSDLFLILKTSDYNISYAGMLEWENTMITDVAKLFIQEETQTRSLENIFSDVVINNKDARVLENKKGQGILYYLFTDKNTLLITTSLESAREITSRLVNKR